VGTVDFGDQGMSPEQAKFAADPGRATTGFVFVVGALGEEDGAEMAITEAVDGELSVVDGGQ